MTFDFEQARTRYIPKPANYLQPDLLLAQIYRKTSVCVFACSKTSVSAY